MLAFLQRNRVLLSASGLLLASLLLVSISSRTRMFQDPVARLLLDGLAPIQAVLTRAYAGIRDTWDRYLTLVDSQGDNERLRQEIAALEQQSVRLAELERENQRLIGLLDFRAGIEGIAYSARVIGRDPLPWLRTLTLDRGERDGIRRGMAVLAPQGVVGQITQVSHTASRVLVLTDSNSGIDALVQRSRARGIVQGGVDAGCSMKYLRRAEDVGVGDRIVTSGLDNIFPKGIVIGTVVAVELRDRGLLQAAVIQPSAPLDQLEEVLIVDPSAQIREGES
jgi:rod shape-determining protein MreC